MGSNQEQRRHASARAGEIVAAVRQLEIRTNRAVEELWAGQYRSAFRGRGMDFDEVREYAHGDEIRSIDWKVTARMGDPHVKKFVEDRERTVMLLVDVSASGRFGSVSAKRDTIAEIAGALAFAALRCGDRVGVILFTDVVELYLPPAKGRAHGQRILRELLFYEPRNAGTDIGVAIDYLNRVATRRGVALLLSDFCTSSPDALDEIGPALRVAGRRHDLVGCAVNDPWELELPRAGRVTLEDAETGVQVEVDTESRLVRRAWAAQADRRRVAVRRALRGAGGELLELTTDRPYLPELARFFESRRRRGGAI